jgi:hypothetical protein
MKFLVLFSLNGDCVGFSPEYDVNVEVLANLGVVDTHAEPDFVSSPHLFSFVFVLAFRTFVVFQVGTSFCRVFLTLPPVTSYCVSTPQSLSIWRGHRTLLSFFLTEAYKLYFIPLAMGYAGPFAQSQSCIWLDNSLVFQIWQPQNSFLSVRTSSIILISLEMCLSWTWKDVCSIWWTFCPLQCLYDVSLVQSPPIIVYTTVTDLEFQCMLSFQNAGGIPWDVKDWMIYRDTSIE